MLNQDDKALNEAIEILETALTRKVLKVNEIQIALSCLIKSQTSRQQLD